jgi:hypothetical protein
VNWFACPSSSLLSPKALPSVLFESQESDWNIRLFDRSLTDEGGASCMLWKATFKDWSGEMLAKMSSAEGKLA